jgi:trk system potassium uptake protein TrkH
MFKKIRIKFDYFVGFVAVSAFALLLLENSAYLKPFSQIVGEINLAIALIFILDILLRFFSSSNKKKYLLHNWFDLVVFAPFIQLVQGIDNTPFSVIVRQTVIIFMLFSRIRKSTKLINLLSLKPAQLMLATFALAIGVGTVLLMLPAATRSGIRTSLIDALFTATSATCVTGLIVKDTGTYFSVFGQMVILALIQVGGLGIMTFSVSLALILGKRMNMKQEVIMTDVLDQSALSDVKNLVMYIFKMTFIFEFFGAVLLFLAWVGKTGGVIKTVYYSVFHSVSAFCNAGFSTFTDNLMGFREDTTTNAVICVLIVLGGLGFMVIKDLQENFRNRLTFSIKRKSQLKVQTKIVLWTSMSLIILGGAAFYFLEKNALFSEFSPKGKVLASLFQSVTARTAGFNSCDIAGFSLASLLVMMGLMFVGGSPGSTAGGVKTTTFSILWATLAGEFQSKNKVEMFKRTIPEEVIRKAAIIFFSSLVLVFLVQAGLLFTEKKMFSDTLFETISAFGTVGLSTGLTPALSLKGKLMITALMFIGRLGPLTVGYAFLKRRPSPKYEYASESVAIG